MRRAYWTLLVMMAVGGGPDGSAQSVVDLLVEQRRAARTAEVMDMLGEMTPYPPRMDAWTQTDPYWSRFLHAQSAARADSAARRAARQARAAARADSAAQTLLDLSWEKTDPTDQGAFLSRYRDVYWEAIPRTMDGPLDTLGAPVVRGRLTALFGTPTRNAAAARQERYAGAQDVQFEYWLVVNDSIPVLAMDLRGPFGKGVLLATSERHARLADALKADLARLLNAAAARPPVLYLDYYRDPETGQWYETGYDGEDFFARAIRTPRWARNFVSQPRKWIIHR